MPTQVQEERSIEVAARDLEDLGGSRGFQIAANDVRKLQKVARKLYGAI